VGTFSGGKEEVVLLPLFLLFLPWFQGTGAFLF